MSARAEATAPVSEMLADTNRLNSRDLVDEGEQVVGEPFAVFEADISTEVRDSAAGVISAENPIRRHSSPAPRGGSPAAPAEEHQVVSEHLFVDFDRQLSRGENRPTWLYNVCLVGWVPCGLMFPFGGYCWPSLVAAFENDDPLTAYFVLSFATLWAVVTPFFVRESRCVFRADAEGPLVLLGAGEQLISQAQDKAVRRHNKLLNLTFGRPANIANVVGLWSPWIAPFIIMSFMDTGIKHPYGDESATVGPARVGLTASLALFGCYTTTQVYYSWGTALYLATTLVSAKTNSIRAAVRHELEISRGEEYWQTKVVEPCKELVVALAVLNGNFSRGMILQVSYFLLLVTGFSCMLLSKFFDNL